MPMWVVWKLGLKTHSFVFPFHPTHTYTHLRLLTHTHTHLRLFTHTWDSSHTWDSPHTHTHTWDPTHKKKKQKTCVFKSSMHGGISAVCVWPPLSWWVLIMSLRCGLSLATNIDHHYWPFLPKGNSLLAFSSLCTSLCPSGGWWCTVVDGVCVWLEPHSQTNWMVCVCVVGATHKRIELYVYVCGGSHSQRIRMFLSCRKFLSRVLYV